MTAGQRADGQRVDALPREGEARRLAELESAVVALRADNEALRAQLALRDHALDATPSFFVITRQEHPAPIIVYCNKIVAETHGYARDELIGKPVTLLTQWVGRNPIYIAEVQVALRAGRTAQYEEEVTRPDGSTFWLGVTIRPLYDTAGRFTHSVAVGADILEDHPILAFILRLCFAAFAFERRKATRLSLDYVREVIDSGWHVLLAPEGRLSTTGELLDFKSGVGLLAVKLGVPVVPMRIDGLSGTVPMHAWWPKKHSDVIVRIGEPQRFGPDVRYRVATRALREAVESL